MAYIIKISARDRANILEITKRKTDSPRLNYICRIITMILCVLGVLGFTNYTTGSSSFSCVMNIDHQNVIHHISDKYLSVALDSSIIRKNWKNFDMNSPALLALVSALSPAYLRLGGTAADCLIFESAASFMNQTSSDNYMPDDGGLCAYDEENCYFYHKNFTMRANDWLIINKFLKSAGLDLIFDLNVLLRESGHWDPSNAIELIQFSKRNNLDLSWQLGNEPNSFKWVFNRKVSGAQLARDFIQLRGILSNIYGNKTGLVVGPDVTRPRPPHFDSLSFLQDFIEEINISGETIIDAITWHHYYLNGKDAELKDFFDLANFDILAEQINLVKKVIVKTASQDIPVWITETSDAYGGGAPYFTDRFVGGFLWLDKLGLAAYHGIQMVARQSIFGGYYALIDEHLRPLPDYWLSLLHKKLVGNRVLRAQIFMDKTNYGDSGIEKLRFYCHCAPSKVSVPNVSAVTVFGMNLGSHEANIDVRGLENAMYRDTYILQGENGVQSRYAMLNGKRLEMMHKAKLPKLEPIREDKSTPITLPSHSIGFWVYSGSEWSTVCT